MSFPMDEDLAEALRNARLCENNEEERDNALRSIAVAAFKVDPATGRTIIKEVSPNGRWRAWLDICDMNSAEEDFAQALASLESYTPIEEWDPSLNDLWYHFLSLLCCRTSEQLARVAARRIMYEPMRLTTLERIDCFFNHTHLRPGKSDSERIVERLARIEDLQATNFPETVIEYEIGLVAKLGAIQEAIRLMREIGATFDSIGMFDASFAIGYTVNGDLASARTHAERVHEPGLRAEAFTRIYAAKHRQAN